MQKNTPQTEAKGIVRLQTKKQQQAKKDKLANALRDNLRRRKAASQLTPEAGGGDDIL